MADSFYTPEENEEIDRRARRYLAEKKIVDELDARARRDADAEAQASAERHAKAALALANARKTAAAPRVRTKYEGPDPDRASRGNFVSKEELADFQRKYGADKTLRDLLNADRGLTRRGSSPLTGSGRGTAAGMGAADQVVLRPDPYADTSRVMEGVAAKQREMSRPGRDAIENVYPETALIPATRLGPLAARAAQAIRGAMASSGRAKEEPAQPPELGQGVWRSAREKAEAEARNTKPPELGQGVWRSAREKAEAEARNAKPRVQVEGTKGGVYRGTKEETASEVKPEFRSRTADRMDEREMEFKRGGKVKAYAKGGSVKGSGCEQRGLRKCKIY